MNECCFANVRLPLNFQTHDGNTGEGKGKVFKAEEAGKVFKAEEAGKIGKWINVTAAKEFDTYLQIAFHADAMWVRLSAQIYLEVADFEWVGYRLEELCGRVQKGEVK
jgi:hypothetical protein